MFVRPKLIEQGDVGFAFRGINFVDHAEHVATALTAQVRPCESIDWRIRSRMFVIHSNETRHRFVGTIRLEVSFFTNPISAFL